MSWSKKKLDPNFQNPLQLINIERADGYPSRNEQEQEQDATTSQTEQQQAGALE